MPLTPGTRIGPYEIIAPIGAGGMGEVYRATDTNLKRAVAIKVLPAAVASDAHRLARFQREAELLAALTHPNIAQIYGLERPDGNLALVLELVEGPTLADRLARGAMPLSEALRVAMQIADALDAAHASGIIHRDLKPANIKIRPDGSVKVLDFGLAKLVTDGPDLDESASDSSTVIASATQPGIVLGTPAYMAPEQARGGSVDKRADTWAFGAVLFEMLTGRSPFGRPSAADTIGAVMHEEPDWTVLPAGVQRLVRSCLQKDPKQRLRDIADARLLIDEPPDARSAPQLRSGRLGWAVAGIFALVAGVVAWGPWRAPAAVSPTVRFQITPSVTLPASGASAISPDGRHLAYIGTGSDRVRRIWVRAMDSLIDRPLPGTEVRGPAAPPFWSPDSRFIGFDGGGALKKVDVSGGLAQTICELAAPAIGGSWNGAGVVIFGSVAGPIMRVPEDGGTPSPLTAPDPSEGGTAMHLLPAFLPDGRHFLYLRTSPTSERAGIFVGAIDVEPAAQDRRRLVATPTSAVYVPGRSSVGTLLFLRDGNLMGQPFDEKQLATSAEPRLIAERVDSYLDGAIVSASHTGVLVYRSAASLQLTWLDRQGRLVDRVAETGLYITLALSPDGTRGVVSKTSALATSTAELWVYDFARKTSARFTAAESRDAAWSPEGSRIVFDSRASLYVKTIAGPQETLLSKGTNLRRPPTSWSPDGRFVLFTIHESRTASDIWAMSMEGEHSAVPFLHSDASESQGQFFPRVQRQSWIAYTSNESGRDEVFLRTFPDAGNMQVVSRNGGHSPRWRGDGTELFYVAADGTVMAATFDSSTGIGVPVALFKAPSGFASRDATGSRTAAPWAVTPDGQRFLFAAPEEGGSLNQLTVVLNWQAGS